MPIRWSALALRLLAKDGLVEHLELRFNHRVARRHLQLEEPFLARLGHERGHASRARKVGSGVVEISPGVVMS